MLNLTDIKAGYEGSEVLHSINVSLENRKITTIIGPNGAGKTTLLKTILKIVRPSSGKITFEGCDLTPLNTAQVVKNGIGYVPQGANVFPQMSVKEDLEMGGFTVKDNTEVAKRIEQVLEIFPVLRDKLNHKSGFLSGGQRRMLAIARALVSNPKLLLLDEPSIGLDIGRQSILFDKLIELNKSGLTILFTEQNIAKALEVSDTAYLISSGTIKLQGPSMELKQKHDISKILFGQLSNSMS